MNSMPKLSPNGYLPTWTLATYLLFEHLFESMSSGTFPIGFGPKFYSNLLYMYVFSSDASPAQAHVARAT